MSMPNRKDYGIVFICTSRRPLSQIAARCIPPRSTQSALQTLPFASSPSAVAFLSFSQVSPTRDAPPVNPRVVEGGGLRCQRRRVLLLPRCFIKVGGGSAGRHCPAQFPSATARQHCPRGSFAGLPQSRTSQLETAKSVGTL